MKKNLCLQVLGQIALERFRQQRQNDVGISLVQRRESRHVCGRLGYMQLDPRMPQGEALDRCREDAGRDVCILRFRPAEGAR